LTGISEKNKDRTNQNKQPNSFYIKHMLRIYTEILAALNTLLWREVLTGIEKFPILYENPVHKTGTHVLHRSRTWTPREKKGMVICFLVTTAVLGRSYYITRGYGEDVFTRVTKSLPHIRRSSPRNTLIMSWLKTWLSIS